MVRAEPSAFAPRGQAHAAPAPREGCLPCLPGSQPRSQILVLQTRGGRCLPMGNASRNGARLTCVEDSAPASGPGGSEPAGGADHRGREAPGIEGTIGFCGMRRTRWGHRGLFPFCLVFTTEVARAPSNVHILSTTTYVCVYTHTD